jgi:phosphatidyl-myo-inositol dimannoside synthase
MADHVESTLFGPEPDLSPHTILKESPEYYIPFCSELFQYYGGVSDYTNNLAKQLKKKGKLRLVAAAYAEQFDFGYEVVRFKAKFQRGRYALDRWKIISKILTLLYFIRFYISSWKGLRNLVGRKENTCIVFSEYYTENFDIIIRCARFLKIRYGIIFHGLDLICAKNKRFYHFRKNFEKADFVIFNSHATEDLCKELFHLQVRRSQLVYPGIDISRIAAKQGEIQSKTPIRPEPGTIIFSTVSRLIQRKGIDIAIRMVNELSKSHPNICYYIAGSGDKSDELEKLIGELGAGSFIHLIGEISDLRKYQLLEESDFFLLPNHSAGGTDFEGFGISFIEASLFGNVVIGGKQGGVKEAVRDSQTGFLFDFDRESAWAEAVEKINELLADLKKIKEIQCNGVNYVNVNFDWNKLIDQFLDAGNGIANN